jgi:hypothetical protein
MIEMVNLDVLITAGIGLVSTFIGSWTSWFFARKKYNSEVDNNIIQNMKESLEFYKQLSDDNKKRLEEVLKRNEELERRDEKLEDEVRQLKNQMITLMSQICLDLTCKVRQKELFGNGTNTEKKI